MQVQEVNLLWLYPFLCRDFCKIKNSDGVYEKNYCNLGYE